MRSDGAVGSDGRSERSLSGRRALVTGASGFIGSHLAARLLDEGAEVYVLLRSGSRADRLRDIRNRLQVIEGDVTDVASLRAAFATARPELVFHLAADTGVRRLSEGWNGVERSIRVNLEGTLAVLRSALEASHPVRAFVRTGGLEEYGTGATPYDERQREEPISPYSASQVAATHYCEMLQRGTDVAIVTLRPALIYGPGQSSDFFIPSLIASCLRGADFPMTSGQQKRDLLYISDLMDAFVLASLNPDSARGVINLGHGVEHAMADVAREIVRLTGTTGRVLLGARPEREGDLVHLVTMRARAAERLGWAPRVELTEGLRLTIEAQRAELLRPA